MRYTPITALHLHPTRGILDPPLVWEGGRKKSITTSGTYQEEGCSSSVCTMYKMRSFQSIPFTVITAHKGSLGQGNIFSSVCQEFCP